MILEIKNLSVTVVEENKEKYLLKDINLQVKEERIFSLVGGSGSGKTTTGFSILGLLSMALRLKQGEIIFQGKNLLSYSQKEMQTIRGKYISMIFQEPLNAFNPVFTIGYQIDEILQFHTDLSNAQRQKKILELLDIVEIKEPQRVAQNYPHQLSGGMRQRAMIAQAIATNPKLIIADEPTSSLDVTLQARIIELFRKLKTDLNISMLLITHDLGLVKHLADEVAVMREGHIVESGETHRVLEKPQHSYTRELMKVFMT